MIIQEPRTVEILRGFPHPQIFNFCFTEDMYFSLFFQTVLIPAASAVVFGRNVKVVHGFAVQKISVHVKQKNRFHIRKLDKHLAGTGDKSSVKVSFRYATMVPFDQVLQQRILITVRNVGQRKIERGVDFFQSGVGLQQQALIQVIYFVVLLKCIILCIEKNNYNKSYGQK